MSSASRRLIAKFILGCGSSTQKASASGVGANFWATTSNGVAFATSVNWPGFPWQGIQRIAASCLPLLASAENAGVAAKPANRSVHKRVIAHVTVNVVSVPQVSNRGEASVHSCQCVGSSATRRLVRALIQPPSMRRQGKTNGNSAPAVSATANSRSRSKGARAIGIHCIAIGCSDTRQWR